MIPTPRMLLSAGVVGVILVGGVAVAHTASAGRLQEQLQLKQITGATPEALPLEPEEGPAPGFSPDPDVVSKHMSEDPAAVGEYWTPERLQGAEPMPIPEVSISIKPRN
ncbi:hypothetical protein [Acrocarpospora catenulata]|uniref:hypothetical protein n=1 Tax=Acrocarpospora catenulata TaxID=2836182 RepID=UPI001BD94C02|nr:hypothetical protein [Acrocarpospora catenulata]